MLIKSLFSEGFVLMWKKGKDMIALGDRMMGNRGARFRLEKSENGNTLVISLAEPDDAGEYSCQISASRPMELRHSVSIRGKLLITITIHLLSSYFCALLQTFRASKLMILKIQNMYYYITLSCFLDTISIRE